ncbi:CvpA family protein [Coxiella endosymbiont of Amblyomma americanum]|uniref:CvpA family protein n=1 Tax=Coxiella endosymbiont of Amblyomma americanum TaxID=325775 RepID=UPI00057EF163|nr:CvpA family protein [Coxiella endosymbiont of Amblyomma americanum]AUJ58901.1 colicin V synthesis protein [Coxiella-like endosymbiont of Amblyomma americanum]
MNFGIVPYLNWIDCTIVSVITFSVVIGLFRGFVRETISLMIWIAAVTVAFKFSKSIQLYLYPWINLQSLRYAITFGGLFLTVFIFGIFINSVVHTIVKKMGLTVVNHTLGIFFGMGRGLFIIAIFLALFDSGNMIGIGGNRNIITQSRLAPKFQPIVIWLHQLLPSQLKNVFQWLEEAASN